MASISDDTPIKLGRVQAACDYLAAVVATIHRKPGMRRYFPFLIVDMNAADGAGTSRIAIDTCTSHGIPIQAYLIDNDYDAHMACRTAYASWSNVQVAYADHDAAISTIRTFPIAQNLGVILHDPCGIPSYGALREWSDTRVDIILYVNSGQKRYRQGHGLLCDELPRIKHHWLITEPITAWQHTVLVGTNWREIKDYRRYGLYLTSSTKGDRWLRELSYTIAEREQFDAGDQMSLF